MLLLPSQQTSAQKTALALFLENEAIYFYEPCDCGGQVRHNNGGNYHQELYFRMDAGKCWRCESSTSDYAPEKDWSEVTFSAAIDEIAALAAKGGGFYQRR